MTTKPSQSVPVRDQSVPVCACGNSWIGFWKLKNRYEAWLGVADSASKTADAYAMMLKQIGILKTSPLWKDVEHWNKLFLWAYGRAKKMRPDYVLIYRPRP